MSLVWAPRGRGAKAAIVCRGEVLLVLHTYGPRRWELPGGGVHRGEEPIAAMRRELHEELGLEVGAAAAVASVAGPGRYRRYTTHIFRVDIDEPRVRVDPVEIAELRWCDPQAPPQPLAPLVGMVLERVAGGQV